VIRGRDMAIQLFQSTISEQSDRIRNQEALITRLTAKVELAEVDLNVFHKQLTVESGSSGIEDEEQKLFASQLRTIQENFSKLLTRKEEEIMELRHQVTKQEEMVSSKAVDIKPDMAVTTEPDSGVNGESDFAGIPRFSQSPHDETSVVESSIRLQELEAKYKEMALSEGDKAVDTEADNSTNADPDPAVLSTLSHWLHDSVEASSIDSSIRLRELESEVERLRDSLLSKDRKLALSSEQLLSVQSELQRLRNTITAASSSDVSLYSTCSDTSVELLASESRRMPCEEVKTGRLDENSVWKKDDIPEPQVDRRIRVVHPRQTHVVEIAADELQRNSDFAEAPAMDFPEKEDSVLPKASKLETLNGEELQSLLEVREAEIERLRKELQAASDELAWKREECIKLTVSIDRLNESDAFLNQKLTESASMCEALRKELTERRDETGEKAAELEKVREEAATVASSNQSANDLNQQLLELTALRAESTKEIKAKDLEIEKLREALAARQDQLLRMEDEQKELTSMMEECRYIRLEKENLLEESEREALRLNDLVLLLQTSQSELESTMIGLRKQTEEKSSRNSEQMKNLMLEVAEAKKLNEETNLALTEKMRRIEKLSRECELLHETIDKYRNNEMELTARVETLMDDRVKAQETFRADMNLIRAEVSEQQQRLESTIQALSDKDNDLADSLREIESLTETVSQLRTSLGSSGEQIELLRSEAVWKDQELESMMHALSEKDAAIADSVRETQFLSETVNHLQNKGEELELLRSGDREKDGKLEGLVQALAAKDDSIAANLREIESLMESISQLRTLIEGKDVEIERFRSQISAQEGALSEKNEETSKLIDSANDLSKHLAESQMSCEQLGTEVAKYKDQIAANEMELKNLRDEILRVRHELASKAEACTELTSLLEESRHMIVEKENLLEMSVKELVEMKIQHEETKSLLADVSQALAEEQGKFAGSSGEVEFLKEIISQLELSLQNKMDEINQQKCLLGEQEVKIADQKTELMICSQKLEEHEVMKREFLNQLSLQEDGTKSLREEVDQSQSLCEQLRTELAEAKNQVSDTEVQLEELQANNSVIQDELIGREATCKELTVLLEESRAAGMEKDRERSETYELLLQEYNLLQETLGKYQKNKERLMAEMESRENELQKINTDLDLARVTASTKEQQVEAMIESLSDKDANAAETLREIQSLSDVVSDLQLTLQNRDQEIESLKSAALEKAQELEGMIQTLSEKDVANLREIESLTENISELQTLLLSKDEEISQQKLLAEVRETTIAEKDSEIKNYCRKLQEHEIMKGEFMNQLATQEDVIRSLKDELASSSSKVDETQSQLQLLTMEIVEKDGKILELSESDHNLREQLARSELLREELRNDLTEVKCQLEENEAKVNSLQAAVLAVREELARKDEECDEIAKSATGLSESSTFLQQQLAESRSTCEELRNELQNCRAQIEASETELKTVQNEISGCQSELVQKDERCRELSDLLWDMEGVIKEKEDLLGNYVKEMEELNRRNEEASSLLSEKTTQVDELSREVDLLQESVGKYKDTERELTAQIAMLAESRESDLQRFNSELQLLRDESSEKLEDLARREEALKVEIGVKDEKILHLTTQVETIKANQETDLEKFDAELQLVRDEIDRLLEDAMRREEALKSEIAGKDDQILQLNESIASLTESSTALSEQLNQTESLCEELRNELDRDKGLIETRDAELDNLQGIVLAVQTELATKTAECRELTELSRNQLIELDKLRIELMQAQEQLEAKEAKLAKLQVEISASQIMLTAKETECTELSESIATASESATEQFARSDMSGEAMKNELATKDQDPVEAQDTDMEKMNQEISVSSSQPAEDDDSPAVERETLQESAVFEVPESLSRAESLEKGRVNSDVNVTACMYDVMECVGPRYRITSSEATSGDVSEALKCWTQFMNLLTRINTELEETTSLIQENLASVGSEELSADSHFTEDLGLESNVSGGATVSTLPTSTLAAMAENIRTIRRCIERHEHKPSPATEDVEVFHTRLSELSQTLEERTKELEAARLEVETGTVRFEKLKAKSIAKIKELTKKHQVAMESKEGDTQQLENLLAEFATLKKQKEELNSLMAEKTTKLEELSREKDLLQDSVDTRQNAERELMVQKDGEMSELTRKLREQELEIAGLRALLETVTRDLDEAKERCLSADNRVEELEILLREKNAQIMAMLDQVGGKDVADTSTDSSIRQPVVENLSHERTVDTDLLSPLQSGNADTVKNTLSSVDLQPLETATAADVLKSILLNTTEILDSLLPVGDGDPSWPTSCKESFALVQQYAEKCREMICDLQATSELKESQLQAVRGELEEKKTLANKYAAAAKKLKQQTEKWKSDFSDVSELLKQSQEQNLELSSQLSALQLQCMEKDTELEQLQASLNSEKEHWTESLMEMINSSQAEVDRLKEVNANLEMELSLQVKAIDEIQTEVDARRQAELLLNTANDDLRQLLDERSEQLEKLSAENEANLAAKLVVLESMERDLNKNKEDLLQSQKEKDKQLTELDAFKSDLMQAQNQLEAKEAELEKLQAEAEVNLANMVEMELIARDLNKAKEDLVQLQKERDDQLAELDRFRTELTEAQNQLEAKEAELEKLQAKVEANVGKLMEKELIVREKDAQISELTTGAEVNGNELMELQQLLSKRDEELMGLRVEADTSKAQVMELGQTLEAQTEQLNSLFTANQELKNLLNFNDRETGELVESHSTTMQQLVTEVGQLQDRLSVKTMELDQVVAGNRELIQRMSEKDEEICRCSSNVVALKQEVERLKVELDKRSADLKQHLDELATTQSMHESDVSALQEQLAATQKDKLAFEVELNQKIFEMEERFGEELNSERLLSEKLRSESENLAVALRNKDEMLNSLTNQLSSMDNTVSNYETQLSEFQLQIRQLESQSAIYQQQLAEAQTAPEQKERELAALEANSAKLASQLDTATSSVPLDRADKDTETDMDQDMESGGRKMPMGTPFVETHESSEMSDVLAQNTELMELNSQMKAEIATMRNHLADFEVKNCTLRNTLTTSQNADGELAVIENGSSGLVDTSGVEVYQPGVDGAGNSEDFPICRLLELSPTVVVDPVTERIQGAEQPPIFSDELSSMKEKCCRLESSCERLKEELLAERQNSAQFRSVETLRQGLEEENEKNLAQIEALTATRKKMLAKLKELKTSNDSLMEQVDDLRLWGFFLFFLILSFFHFSLFS